MWTRHQRRTAEDLLAELRFEEAGRMLDDYLRIRPSDPEARLLAAQAKRRAGDLEAAERELNEFDRLRGQTSASALEWALLLAERGELGDKEFWLRVNREKIHKDPVVLLEAQTQNFQSLGRFDDALLCLDHLLKECPFHPRALVWRAQVLGAMQNWDAAVHDARRAVDIQPDSQEARLIWAEANEHVGQTKKAVEAYRWLYECGNRNPDVVLGLGRGWQDLGQFADARQVLDALLAEQPARSDVLVERGRLALREAGTTAAQPYFQRAVVADSNNEDAHRFLLRCLVEAGGHAEECARVEARLRQLEIRDGRVAQLNCAVLAAPKDIEPRYQMGLFMLQNGWEKDGLNMLKTVLSHDPRHELARAALADYYQRTGRAPGAGGRP
jgi:Tfp pilus assembly protein PilF